MAILHPWMCLVLISIMVINVYGTSLAHSVFLPSDKNLNPFSDLFIQKFLNINRKKLNAITQMDGNALLLSQLMNDDNALDRSSTRQIETDSYEFIFNDKLDDQLILQENIDSEWVQLMTAGPLAINFVSNLLTLASKRDFPLSRPPKLVFKHIKEPDSFRATIAQVSGSMYSALLGAHTAMDHIQLNVQQVPNQIKTVLKLALAGSPLSIKIMLPTTLESISQIANESATHARLTFNKFSSLQELLAEIIEASVNTHSTHGTIVDQIKVEINKTKLEQDQLNNNINSITAQYEDARRETERARREYQDAQSAIPTARRRMKRFLGGIGRAIGRAVDSVVSAVTAPWRFIGCILGFCTSDRSAYETAKQNAIARANLLLGALQDAEKRQAVFAQEQAVEQKKLIDVIQQIAALDLNRMSEEEIVDILIKSLVQMSEIKKQWGRLIQFFSKLSVQADSTQQIVVSELINVIQSGEANQLLINPVDREFFVEILSEICQEIERGAHLLYVMSKTYYDISSEYMVNQITSMHALLLLQTDTERSFHLQSLSSNANSTATRIIQLAQERQNEYTSRNKARRDEFTRFLAEVAQEELNV